MIHGKQVFGRQTPNIMSVPNSHDSSGDDAIDLAEMVGLKLDPWQKLILREGLGEKIDGSWASFEVCTVVSRQNGKGAIIEARILAGLFLFGERLIIHTAHEVKTALEAFSRVTGWIEGNADLKRKVKRIVNGKGSESIEIACTRPKEHGPNCKIHRVRFMSRTHSSGRGFSADCVILDESMSLGAESMAALLPTLSARENPQVWYFGSAGLGQRSTQLALLRKRGLEGGDDSLAYFEWSVPVHEMTCLPSCNVHSSVDDEEAWLATNPAIGFRLTLEYIAKELKALGAAMFARERLGVGDYPEGEIGNSPIGASEWVALANRDSEPGDDIVFAVDIPPDRSSATIVSYSLSANRWGHVELVDRRAGTDWVPERLSELKERWNPVAVALDGKSPAASLLVALAAVGIEPPEESGKPDRGDLFIMSVADMQSACGNLVDAVKEEAIRHLGDEVLTAAVAGSCTRPIGDSWVWTRRKSTMDISPLVGLTTARYVFRTWFELVSDYDILSSAF